MALAVEGRDVEGVVFERDALGGPSVIEDEFREGDDLDQVFAVERRAGPRENRL